jgi:hypothetical protein
MCGIEIVYDVLHTFTPCESLEQAYFISTLLCITPFSYLDFISSYSTCKFFTISREKDITITIYFGSVIPSEATYVSLHDLSNINLLCKRRNDVLQYKRS